MASSDATNPIAPDPNGRAIKHMNADHHDSLVRYLEHFHSLPSHTARHARLTHITLYSLTLTTSTSALPILESPGKPSNSYIIPLDPPLKSFSEIRERLVALDAQCIGALKRSPITVKAYPMPKGLQATVLSVCIATFLVLGRRATLAPPPAVNNTPLFGAMAQRYPAAFAWLYKIQPQVLYPMIAVHLTEAVWMDRSRLSRHSVARGSGVWWMWIVGTFLGGFPHFSRIDAMVEEEKARKEKLKH